MLAPPLAPAVFERLPPLSAAAETSTPFAGRYHSADLDATYDVTVDGQTLVVSPAARRPSLVVTPIGRRHVRRGVGSPTVTFQSTGAGSPAMTISMGRVRRLPFTRVGGASDRQTAGR